MSLYELNAKAWDESKGKNCEDTMIIVGQLKWPSQEAFDNAMKELYNSVKHYKKGN
jgi:hypothetical protein